jgi:hypothetical protein
VRRNGDGGLGLCPAIRQPVLCHGPRFRSMWGVEPAATGSP